MGSLSADNTLRRIQIREGLQALVADLQRWNAALTASHEAAVSRLYGGLHFAFDNGDGLASGQCIGQAISDRVRFRNEDDE
jgi:hypothetical protein